MWDFFSGKKTAIGAVALWVSMFLTQVVIGEWGIDSALVGQIATALTWIGGVLVPGGLAHKAVKTTPEAPK